MQKRHITPFLLDALSDSPAVLLNGARQTGKTTLSKNLVTDGVLARYITFDDVDVLAAARSDPAGFINGISEPVVLDEIQHVPELLRPIKSSIDKDRRPGRFLLTGSANVLLLPALSESLAGRMEILTLWPLSQGEIAGHHETFVDKLFDHQGFSIIPKAKSSTTIAQRITGGGYPEMLTRKIPQRQEAWFKSYITAILQKDIRELSNIEGLTEIPKLLSLLATRSANLLNYAELSRSTSLPQTTLKRYMSLLEMTFLIQLLPAWSNNLGKRFVKSPKLMLNDTGLASYLLGINAEKLMNDTRLLGQLFENFVGNELRKQSSWSKIQPQLFHFRSLSNDEVDIVLEDREHRIVGIEIKAKTALTESDFKGLRALSVLADKKFHRGVIIYLGHNIVPIGKNMHAIPIDLLW
ncbi:MAG TPA: ATP-binding protein [Gammaproteobacteria bacterium]|nr:ATP-binding protein [Gammaproteobacteria bacterium]